MSADYLGGNDRPTYQYDEKRKDKRYSLYLFVSCNIIDSSDALFLSYQKTPLHPSLFNSMSRLMQNLNEFNDMTELNAHQTNNKESQPFQANQFMFNITMASNRQIMANQLSMKYKHVSISAGGISFPVVESNMSDMWGNNFNPGDLVRVSLMGGTQKQPPLHIDVVGKILRVDLKGGDEEAIEASLAIQFAYGSPEKKELVEALVSSHL